MSTGILAGSNKTMIGVETPSTPVETICDALEQAESLARHVNQFLDDLLRRDEGLGNCERSTIDGSLFEQMEGRAYEARRNTLNAIDRIIKARGVLGL
nr:hypothetical protein [Brucella intermedia]